MAIARDENLSSQFFAAKSGDSPEEWLSVKNHLIDTMGVIADLCGNESSPKKTCSIFPDFVDGAYSKRQ